MINMMYLVLTAMLALNVSKEVLDAFAYMDADLVRSERAHEQRSQLEYMQFAKMAESMPLKYGAKHQQALRVKALADSLVQHIDRLKLRAISTADKAEEETLRAPDGAGHDTLRSLMALEAKDDRSTLTRMMIGSDPAIPHKEPDGAVALKERIAIFRDSLIALANASPELTASLNLLFDLGDRRDASGTMNNWESINFYDVPLAAGIATLSKLQSDVRAAENDMVKWLYRSVGIDDVGFSTLTTAIVPQSNLIMLGDSFRADVFLAAYDPLNPPQVTASTSTLPIGSDGKAKLRLKGDRVGEQKVEGTIRFTGPDGVKEYPYSTSFQVMPPVLVASPTKMNVLYRGVRNPIDISVPGVPADRVQPVTNNGRLERDNGGWIVKDLSAGQAEITAIVTAADGSTRRVGPMIFRVKDLPMPMAIVASKNATNKTIRKAELTAGSGISAQPADSPFDDRFKVLSYQVTVIRRDGSVNTKAANGNTFTPEIKQLLESVRTNERVIFEEMKAKLASGEGKTYELVPLNFRVQ